MRLVLKKRDKKCVDTKGGENNNLRRRRGGIYFVGGSTKEYT
jgi:hypothetical protein